MWSYTLLTALSAQKQTKRTVESFQRAFDSTSLQCDSSRAQRQDVRALLSFAPATQYKPSLPNWILWLRFNVFGGFWQCIFSKSVMYVSWVRAYTNKKLTLAYSLLLNKVHPWQANTHTSI